MRPDTDPQLDSLLEELRNLMGSLNRLYHPVQSHDPQRVRRLEAQLAELRAAIAERRRSLAVG